MALTRIWTAGTHVGRVGVERRAMLASAGPTNGRSQGQTVLFEPLQQLAAKGEAVYRMRVKGTLPGDMRFRVKLTCDQMKTPLVKEENTKFYKE